MKVTTIAHSIVVAFSLLLMSSCPAIAQGGSEIKREGSNVTITLDKMQLGGRQIAPGLYERQIEYETIDSLYPQDAHPVAFIRSHQEYTSIKIAVSSKKNALVKVDWDNRQQLVLTNPQHQYQMMQGDSLKLNFTAYGTHKGVIRFFNERGKKVLEIPYSVEKKSHKRNSLRASGGVQYRDYKHDDSELKPSVTLRYRQTISDPRRANRRKSWGFTVDNTGNNGSYFNPRATVDYEVNW